MAISSIREKKFMQPSKPAEPTIGIIGGSFDPPHNGHVAMAKLALKNNLVDKILVIPCDSHPFSKKLSRFDLRYQLCKIAFKNIQSRKNLEILDLEQKLDKPSYTYKTLDFLKKNIYQKNKIKLLIGSDLLEKLDTWHKFEKILELCDILVFPRQSYKINKSSQIISKYSEIKILENYSLPNAQSNLIKQALQKNPSVKPDGLSRDVFNFLAKTTAN